MDHAESTSGSHFRLTGRRVAALLVAAAIGLAGAYSGLAVYKAYDCTTTPRQKTDGRNPADFGMTYEPVSFPSQASDGLILQGWWIEHQDAQRAVVLVHGRYQNRASLLGLASRLWERGYSLLLFDLRGHGQSRLKRPAATGCARRGMSSALSRSSHPETLAGI